MNTLLRIAATATSFLLIGCAIRAQQAANERTGTISVSVQAAHTAPQTMTIRMAAPSAHQAVVGGAPYCAEVTSERFQTLADGTHITNKSHSTKECRDSEGRTRSENSPSGAQVVEIHDPVSGFRYLLDVQNRIAHRFAPPAEKTNSVASYVQTGRANALAASPAPGRPVTPAQPPDRPQSSTESLGTQVIEGILVEGQKTTTTIPTGMMGNDRPIVRVSESWFSPELKRTLLFKNSDPRMGESTMRLESIDRTEPDPALFRVPADYEVVDESGDQVEIKVARP